MTTPYRVITQPAAEPLTLDEVKLHLRVDTDDEGDWIEPQITAARQAAENFCNRFIAEQEIETLYNGWPCTGWNTARWPGGFAIPGTAPEAPARSVVIAYEKDGGGSETLPDSVTHIEKMAAPTRVTLAWGQIWPTLAHVQDAVSVRAVVGYTLPGTSPQDYPLPSAIRSAMLLMIGNWYENREAVVVGAAVAELPLGVQSLLWPYRLALGV